MEAGEVGALHVTHDANVVLSQPAGANDAGP